MDLANESDEIYVDFDELDLENWWWCIPLSIKVSGIHRATLEGDFCKVRRFIERGGCINEGERYYNFSFLHLAVIHNKSEIFDYLLAREDVEVNARCCDDRTPLHLATILGRIKFVEKLIQAGADVNIADNNGDTALHMSVTHPDICDLLLRHGARIRTISGRSETLHEAVAHNCLEIVHMLLYYNVDANDLDENFRTPFMVALAYGNVEAQEVLLEYVVDFNWEGVWHVLTYALLKNSPFVKDIIERGADVNYGDDPNCDKDTCAFSECLHSFVDASTFKIVWEKLRYNARKNTIDFLDLLSKPELVPAFLQVIIESDNFEPAVEYFSSGENYFLFVNKFAEGHFELEQLTVLTCRLLQYHFRASSYDIHAIFSHYGYCELFRIMLYMDNDYSRGWLPQMALSRLVFHVDYDLEDVVDKVNDIPKEIIVQLLEYCICPRLIDALILKYGDDESMSAILSSLPRVPLLIELARNAARKQIWHSFNVTNTCQFYTVIDHLNIPTLYKNILTFKRKMYTVKE